MVQRFFRVSVTREKLTAGESREAIADAFADSDAAAGTTVSGIVGSVMVAGAAVLICLAGGFFRRRKAG